MNKGQMRGGSILRLVNPDGLGETMTFQTDSGGKLPPDKLKVFGELVRAGWTPSGLSRRPTKETGDEK